MGKAAGFVRVRSCYGEWTWCNQGVSGCILQVSKIDGRICVGMGESCKSIIILVFVLQNVLGLLEAEEHQILNRISNSL